MTLEDVVQKLQKQGEKAVRNGWTPDMTHGDETYGLNFSAVKEVAEKLRKDPVLADEMYAGRNHDLKVLATYIDDPESYTRDELNKRSEQLYPSPFAEKFCRQVLANSEHAVHFIGEWISCESCDHRAYAYHTLAELAKKKNRLSDDFYAACLDEIAENIHKEKPDVQEAMHAAMVAISKRDAALSKKGKETAEKIGDIRPNGKKSPLERKLRKATA